MALSQSRQTGLTKCSRTKFWPNNDQARRKANEEPQKGFLLGPSLGSGADGRSPIGSDRSLPGYVLFRLTNEKSGKEF